MAPAITDRERNKMKAPEGWTHHNWNAAESIGPARKLIWMETVAEWLDTAPKSEGPFMLTGSGDTLVFGIRQDDGCYEVFETRIRNSWFKFKKKGKKNARK